MKYFFTYMFTLVSLSGCLPFHPAEKPNRNSVEQQEIDQLCLDLRQNQGFVDLLESIRRDTDQIFMIARQTGMVQESIDKVKELAQKIRVNSDILQEKIEPQFTDPRFIQSVRWRIRPEDFRFILSFDSAGSWKALSIQVREIYSRGSERPDLVNELEIQNEGSDLIVSLQRPAGALEICEFERTFVIVASVQFLGRYGKQSIRMRLIADQGGVR